MSIDLIPYTFTPGTTGGIVSSTGVETWFLEHKDSLGRSTMLQMESGARRGDLFIGHRNEDGNWHGCWLTKEMQRDLHAFLTTMLGENQ